MSTKQANATHVQVERGVVDHKGAAALHRNAATTLESIAALGEIANNGSVVHAKPKWHPHLDQNAVEHDVRRDVAVA